MMSYIYVFYILSHILCKFTSKPDIEYESNNDLTSFRSGTFLMGGEYNDNRVYSNIIIFTRSVKIFYLSIE